MRLKDKIFQMFICGTGSNLDYSLKNNLGGVIFFTEDIKTKPQFIDLVNDIKSKSKSPLFLSIDQEGGRVERTTNIHPRYLSPKDAFQGGTTLLTQQTKTIADELISYGLNMNFAPCLDVNSNPNNPIIGDRAFSNIPEEVIAGYKIVAPVYKEKNIIPVVKHFPGHGDADKDSHKELPIIDLSLSDMEKIHIKPFEYAIKNDADIIMIAHLHCTCFDKEELPTSLSKNCLDYLYKKLHFNGITISDDMYMKGLAKYGMNEACILGIKAGLNMFIYRDSSDETISVIENLIKEAEKDIELRELTDISYNKILNLKSKYNLA